MMDWSEIKREHSEEGPLVGTLPQELSSLLLTGKPVVVQQQQQQRFKERRNPQAPDGSARRNKKKQMLPHRPMEDWELEAPTVANCALGLMLILGVAVTQKDRCHLVVHLRMPRAR